MRLRIASWSFILFTLVFLVVKDGSARKIGITTERDNQVKLVTYDLHQSAAEDLALNNIMQVEGTDLKMKTEAAEEEDDDDHDDHHKHKEKDDEDSDDEDEDDDDEDDHKKKGKHYSKNEHDKDEHKKFIMDPELNVFFTPKDLYVGKTMPIYFAKRNSSTSPKFLPREEAEQIPFSSKKLSSLLKFFSLPKHSPQAQAMKYTLKNCEIEPMEGETKFCATSLESLLDFARYLFGSNKQFKVLTTTHLTNTTVLLQNYTIREVKEISVANVLGCHPMPYPYAVFYCHSQKSDVNLYEMLVEGDNGGKVHAAAICHMDTSMWDSDHVSFRVLHVAPGTSPVCHFFPPDNLVWVPSPAANP
ncbi:hypothetical protein HN51_051600 [Arachis hypogaea]|uniref:BURP domain-containing protein n=1 Tax=Arachis hypogaea TaxID=3818 RepID=A0A445CE60_ARAHY|nr:BURP domain-containing protein BNM2A [Arachis ipaensis]XP_025665986.1 BURP domain-containing protein BNM2A [Arachis hypogaea]QHN92787.1 uncharacterized protein DS421_17g586940 [Arachis hypogaea]RYR49236.1 hypothetical protein Ahy_A07g035588 [Arachis hypogaea]